MKRIFLMILWLSLAVQADFSKSGNIVRDSATSLEWQDDAIGSAMSWEDAITHCENLTLDGFYDWRLPNINELKTLIDDSKINPAIDDSSTAFEHITSNYYWSATTYAGYSSSAWLVRFYNGIQGYYYKTYSNYVRCVRANEF